MLLTILFPRVLQKTKNELFATETVTRLAIKVTSLERTFVDVLDQQNRSGGWEEIYRSIEEITVMNLELVVEYALLLENATTTAKVGYFLEKMRGNLGTTEKQLQMLEKQRPKEPHYLNRSQRKGGIFIKRWNLIVSEEIVEQQWE
ncbi:MAG: hypothetical protein KAT71_04455 [Gammaproteobacteria bacterium]|nr:hypothetical protein [Gammaproteobacteria bacterium]